MENDTFFYSKKEISYDNKFKLYAVIICLSLTPMVMDIIWYFHWINSISEGTMKNFWYMLSIYFLFSAIIHLFFVYGLFFLNWILIWTLIKWFYFNLIIKKKRKKVEKERIKMINDSVSSWIITSSIFLIFFINYLAITNITILRDYANSHNYFITNHEQNFQD